VAEGFDRLVGLYAPELRRQLGTRGASFEGVVATIHTSPTFGESVHTWERDSLHVVLLGFPRIAQALEGEWPGGWQPVCAYSAHDAALRWLPLQPDERGLAPPANLDEASSLMAQLGIEESDVEAVLECTPDETRH
jgi:hypothetical protein